MTPRVCVVAPLYHPALGGLGRQAQQLTEALHRRGVELFVVSRRLAGAPPAEFDPGVDVVRLPAPGSRAHVLEERSLPNLTTSLVFSLRLARFLWRRRDRFDLAHFHGASLPLLVSLPFLKRAKKIVVAKVAAAGLRTEMGDLGRRYLGFGSLLARLGRIADFYVAISQEIRAGLLADGIDAERIVRLDNFVDTAVFAPLAPEERQRFRAEVGFEGRFVVASSGRLVPRKGISDLVEAFALVAARAPNARLLVLGDGPERPRLEGLASRLTPPGTVRFTGRVEAPARWLGMADLFALPSRHEGMPNALLEAMACGLAAVACRIGGVEDLALAGAGLVMTEPGDAPALAAAMMRLAENDREREHLARASMSAARARFGLDARTTEYLRLYRSATASVRGGDRDGDEE
jgi:glycosyltransferase involved in cell wall biosynthesis